MNTIDRRAALGAFAGAAFLAACGEQKPEVRKIPEIEKWPTVIIPGKVEPRTVIEIDYAKEWQFPNIGLEEFIVVTNPKYPIIAVCGLFGKNDAKMMPFSKFNLDGKMGFEKPSTPFKPDLDVFPPLGSTRRDDAPADEFGRFGNESLAIINEKKQGEIMRAQRPFVMRIMSRPPEGEHVYVFGPGVIENRGQRNAMSVLAIKFQFEKLVPAFSTV